LEYLAQPHCFSSICRTENRLLSSTSFCSEVVTVKICGCLCIRQGACCIHP